MVELSFIIKHLRYVAAWLNLLILQFAARLRATHRDDSRYASNNSRPATDVSDPENTRRATYWPGNGRQSLNESHVMMLSPVWLEQFKEEKQKEAFFHCILPPLPIQGNSLKPPFLSESFDADQPLAKHRDDLEGPGGGVLQRYRDTSIGITWHCIE